MNKDGKEKAFEEKSKAILQSIEDLKINSIQLTLEEFENKFAKLKTEHDENVENYSFKDREKVEREVYVLQASLIMRKVAERGIKHKEQLQMSQQATTSTAMIVFPKNKNITLMDRMSKVFSKEPTFPLQPIDLRKINIEWLSKYIPKSMLLELEGDRLGKENRQVDDRYMPDSKAVIYEMFKKRQKDRKAEKDIKEYKLLKNGAYIEVRIIELRLNGWTPYTPFYTKVIMRNGDVFKETLAYDNKYQAHKRLNDALTYADLLDKTFNTNFQQQFFSNNYYKKYKM